MAKKLPKVHYELTQKSSNASKLFVPMLAITLPSPPLRLKTVAFSVPDQWNIDHYWAHSEELGLPCEDLLEEFNREKNEHGTIHVEVKITN